MADSDSGTPIIAGVALIIVCVASVLTLIAGLIIQLYFPENMPKFIQDLIKPPTKTEEPYRFLKSLN